MPRVPNCAQGPAHAGWTPVDLVRINDLVAVSAVTALLNAAHIPFVVTDYNMSMLAGGADAFPIRIVVGDCCGSDARRLLAEAGMAEVLANGTGPAPAR